LEPVRKIVLIENAKVPKKPCVFSDRCLIISDEELAVYGKWVNEESGGA